MNTLNAAVFRAALRTPAIIAALQAQARREISPFDAIPMGVVLRATAGELLRGRLSVLKAFLAAGQRGVRVQRDKRERDALLAALPAPSSRPAAVTGVAAE